MQVRSEEVNTQLQTKVSWPASTPVALAYVDQLTRSKSIQPDRARAVRTALEHADGLHDQKASLAAADQLNTMARQFDADAASTKGVDAARMQALATVLKGRALKLR